MLGCYTCGKGDVTPNACKWDTLENGLTEEIILDYGMTLSNDTFFTSNYNLIVKFVSGMSIRICLKLCQINNFTYAGLINS